MSLDTAAGRAGISKSYLSMLENGRRRFERGGLLSAVAEAPGCSVVDLTGQPYVPADRSGAEALAALPSIREAVYDATLSDPPDRPARPLPELVALAEAADEHRDQNRYSVAGRGLGELLSELHVQVGSSEGDNRRVALATLVRACHVAAAVAEAMGHQDLALAAASRDTSPRSSWATTDGHRAGPL